MGQTEPGEELEAVDVELLGGEKNCCRRSEIQLIGDTLSHPCVHEHEVHLAEGEDGLQDRVDPPQHLVAVRPPGDLEEAAELHAVVDEGAQAESDGPDAEEEAAVAVVVLRRLVLLRSLQGGQLLPDGAAVGQGVAREVLRGGGEQGGNVKYYSKHKHDFMSFFKWFS